MSERLASKRADDQSDGRPRAVEASESQTSADDEATEFDPMAFDFGDAESATDTEFDAHVPTRRGRRVDPPTTR